MTRKITFLAFILFSTFTFAQFGQGPVGHLTIFSENGDKFQLVLNGELINDVPQTNLRVEDLNQPYYNAKVVFEDKTLMQVSKNSLMIANADGILSDVTYKIRRDKNTKGKMKMNYYSSIPVQQGFIPPSNVHVIHYGQPMQTPVLGGVTQTTTTTTQGGGVNVGVNVGGVNMGVSINDSMGGTVTQTTTTTTSNNQINNDYNYNNNTPRQRGCDGRYAMSPTNFNNALAVIKKQGFDDTRLKTAKQIASSNCLNVNQIMQIAKIFGFEDSKLDFAKFAYDYCVEPRNYFNLNSIFSFSSNVEELSDYIQSRN